VRRRLVRFVEDHKEALNALVRVDPSLLLGGRLTPLVALKDCRVFLDFSNKRAFFRQQLKAFHGPKSQFGALPLVLSRKTVVEDTFRELAPLANYMKTHDIRGRPDITFRGEEGIDAGGLTREWFELLCREMFNPSFSLFVASSGEGGATFQPNPLSEAVYGLDGPGGARAWFQFVGRIMGKAVADGLVVDAHFTRSFYKHMLGHAVTFEDDLQPHDPELHRSLQLMLASPLSELGLDGGALDFTISVEHEHGQHRDEELVPRGAELHVTDENKLDYVRLVTAHHLTRSIRAQTNAFLKGFCELVPPSLISLFTPEELELLIAGLPDIDVADLKRHTEYIGYRPTDEAIGYFWQAVEGFDASDRARRECARGPAGFKRACARARACACANNRPRSADPPLPPRRRRLRRLRRRSPSMQCSCSSRAPRRCR
jgi:E3 ubiquitin-protein ligase HUWE1